MMHMEGNRMNINQGVSTKIIKIGTIVALFLVAALVGRNLLFPNSAAAYTNSATGQNTASVAVIKGDVQEVSIKLVSSAYGPIVVQKGIPVRFTIEADARDINGCNGTVVVPAYNLQVALKPGTMFWSSLLVNPAQSHIHVGWEWSAAQSKSWTT